MERLLLVLEPHRAALSRAAGVLLSRKRLGVTLPAAESVAVVDCQRIGHPSASRRSDAQTPSQRDHELDRSEYHVCAIILRFLAMFR